MKYTKFFALFISISFCFNQSQIAQFSFSLKDSLRGALRPERNYNVLHYDLSIPVSYTHLRAHETVLDLVCRLLLEKKKKTMSHNI